jgi:hypothetical protein
MRHFLLLCFLLASTSHAADLVPPVSQRFATAETKDSPDFQRHVVPLLGRLGCNGRGCHGSFQGQGGFQLSLFGYDFERDYKAIVDRVDRKQAVESLILQKPTLIEDHEGGQRLEIDSWQYRLLLQWIKAGSRKDALQDLERLEIVPANILMNSPGESVRIRVVAHWQEGITEDVTCLCRFESRDDTVAAVDSDGLIKSTGRGDTHIVVSYDNGVATVPVIIPLTELVGDNYPEVIERTQVDRLVIAKLRDLGVVPSEICNDSEFLRRASIDLTGTLPAPGEIQKFLADRSPDKRRRKIEELLDSSAYAAWWANRLCDMTGNNPFRQSEGRIGQQLAEQWYAWIYRRVAENMRYDELVAGIVLASGRSDGQSYADYAAEMSTYLKSDEPGDFSLRPTMPHFWTRRNVETPEDKALSFAHSFLGLRLQCAQCHKHPYDRWTQTNFQQFARVFGGLEFGVVESSKDSFETLLKASGQPTGGDQRGQVTQEAAALAAEGRTIAWRELYFDSARGFAGTTNLLGHPVTIAQGSDPREQLMDWLRHDDNPYFAPAFVNRVWANYFHAGLIEPVDDLNLANPPSNLRLLDYLTDGFVSSGYDMKWLHREIADSDTYQRSWRPNSVNGCDRRNFSRAIPRRLPAEVIYDALSQATAADENLHQVRDNLDRRAIGHLATRMAGTYAQRVFGQPERLIACDCERDNSPSLLQAIFLQNDPLVVSRLRDSDWLKEVSATDSPEQESLIQNAYLRTFSRLPDNQEIVRVRAYLTESETVTDGLRDLLWSLINSKEFILNH